MSIVETPTPTVKVPEVSCQVLPVFVGLSADPVSPPDTFCPMTLQYPPAEPVERTYPSK